VLALIADRLPALRGVVHAAGLLEDGVLARQTWDAFQRVLAPKVRGAWNLHELTMSCRLDFFALFSSLAAVLGSGGQGAYAAGNAFLDALARFRHGLGLPATSINWGPWAEVGMAAVDVPRAHPLAERGVRSMAPARALEGFGAILDRRPTQIAVADVDWARYVVANPGRQRAVSRLCAAVPAAGRPAPAVSAAASGSGVDEIRRLPASALPPALHDLLVQQIRATMGLDPAVTLALDAPLKSYGLDSLLAVELRNRLGAAVGANLPASILFDHPSVQALADHLLERLGLAGTAVEEPAVEPTVLEEPVSARPAGGDPLEPILAAIDALSDEEQERLVERLIGSGRVHA
jgi:hypothetical protein